ncbi:uracil-DNA glycosylase [Chitinolyticbacter albus]|uniref:uracil-DNA glycosylase n=1 Tax=Chitinolyticbacter albus TaxID=2961951 RepID=UPI00210B7397|nr:uracil-DNA glycosylase family protein [Chitinolyticbacter albus]
MSRRDFVLSELGLTPLWVRPERITRSMAAASAETGQPGPQPVAQAVPQPVAMEPAPLQPTMRSAADAVRSAIADAAPALRPPLAATSPNPAPATRGAPVQQVKLVIGEGARAERIASLDWQALQREVAGCTACGLCQTRTQTVFGVGNPQAELLVVGEAPGAEEDRQGEPFVGAAGKLLDNLLAAIGEKRGERVFIANVLKCRPPGNRNPQAEEVLQCAPFLARQIALIRPRLIFAVGRFAIQTLLQTEAPVGALRGKVHEVDGIPVVVGYHPAYLLRNLPDKARAWHDLLLVEDQLTQLAGKQG